MYLELKNIEVFYGSVKALKDVSINLKRGEIITLLGANGAGKTTILRAITGLIQPKLGEIWFNGQKIDKLPPYKRVSLGISMVPEERHVYPYMSVKDNLLMGAYLCRDNIKIRNKFKRIYEIFPILKERSKQMGGKLSGGEQQMLAVARCMMADPQLILMDEPSLGLAPIIVKEIAEIITVLNKVEKVSIILVEQNSKMALKISDRAYILELGKIALEDKAKNLINNEQIKKLYLGG
jgi:branched-chain amino acid transport system ATP-binding protein